MTEKLFYQDSHRTEFEAKVTDCFEEKKGFLIVLNKTLFFPEGGGQTSDTGFLNDVEVLDVHEKEGIIYHLTKQPFNVGEIVVGKIDWKERFSKMQQHTGEHIVSGLINQRYGFDNVGFHLGSEKVTMDFNGELNSEQLSLVELAANEAVVKNIDVVVTYPTKDELKSINYRSKIEILGQVRIVEIPGYDRCACCAPHVKNTGEVGIIKLVGFEKYKGGTRVSMLCGFRALADYNMKELNTNKISVLLSAKPESVYEAVLRLKEENTVLRSQIGNLYDKIIANELATITEDTTSTILFEEEFDSIAMRNYVNEATKLCNGICSIFVGNDASGYRYIIGSKAMDVRPISKKLNEAFQGKGGGKPEMVQGSLIASKEEIISMLKG